MDSCIFHTVVASLLAHQTRNKLLEFSIEPHAAGLGKLGCFTSTSPLLNSKWNVAIEFL